MRKLSVLLIVMALTVAGMVAGDTEIDTAESVAVSYPGFFEEMELLGMRVMLPKRVTTFTSNVGL